MGKPFSQIEKGKKNNFNILTAFSFCTLNVDSSLDLWKGKDLIYVIFNSSWDKGGIISNAGGWPQISTWWEEEKRRSLGSKQLGDHSSPARVVTGWVPVCIWVSVFICIFRNCCVLAFFPFVFQSVPVTRKESYCKMPCKGRVQNLWSYSAEKNV